MEFIEFTVEGLPPKKDGANSMWAKSTEIPRLSQLREKAHEAMQGRELLKGQLKLIITIYTESNTGDLDNFVTGICDGLMAANGKAKIDETIWARTGTLHPKFALVYVDDKEICEITCSRKPPENSRFYRVRIETMQNSSS
jgi:hypothetical protein